MGFFVGKYFICTLKLTAYTTSSSATNSKSKKTNATAITDVSKRRRKPFLRDAEDKKSEVENNLNSERKDNCFL